MSMTPGMRTGLIVGGGVVAAGSATYLIVEALRKTSSSPSASGQVSLQVLGYEVFALGTPESVSTTNLQPAADIAPGDALAAAVQATNLTSSPLSIGVRGWIIQAGYSASGRTLVLPGVVTGAVEGHMFPEADPTSGMPMTGTATLPASLFLSPGRSVLGFFSGPISGGIAAPVASLTTLGILWAAGPAAAVTNLSANSGTLPTNQGIAYVWQPSAIQATFNLVAGQAA